MIRLAKKIGRVTCRVAALASSSLSTSLGRASRRRSTDSVTTMAPSTRMPKSIAPSDSRFADTCVRLSSENTDTRASGMVTATTSALRGLPRNRIRIRKTRPMPSRIVCPTLCTVARTRLSRSMYGTILTPSLANAAVELVHLGVNAAQGLATGSDISASARCLRSCPDCCPFRGFLHVPDG